MHKIIDRDFFIITLSLWIIVTLLGTTYFYIDNVPESSTPETPRSIHTPIPPTGKVTDPYIKPGPTIIEDDAGKEIVDPPLYREPLTYAISAKVIKFTITNTDKSVAINVVLNPLTFDYRAETNYENDFYYVHANGSVCFGKPAFKNTYCVREKYTPAVIARYIAGDTNLNVRELNADEQSISNFMNELGWIPNNALASFMSGVELSIKLLYNQKLKDGEILKFKTDDSKEYQFGVIKNTRFLETQADIKTQGINLAVIMALLYNQRVDNPEGLELPLIDLEGEETDIRFEDIKSDGIDINKYILVQ